MKHPCAVIIFDQKATAASKSVVYRPCGAPAGQIIVAGGDRLFFICSRHNARLARAGVVRLAGIGVAA